MVEFVLQVEVVSLTKELAFVQVGLREYGCWRISLRLSTIYLVFTLNKYLTVRYWIVNILDRNWC
jgi:hypothetical protein